MPYGYADSESGAIRYPTLSSLLSTAPQPGMRATALDAPGAMLYEVGGKWGGSLGSVSQTTLDALTPGELAMLADGVIPCRYVPGVTHKSALLGDSIVAQYSSCLMQAAIALGDSVVLNAAVGGTKIEQQAAKIPEIISAGADTVYIQVGTNNAGDSVDVLYGKYLDLYRSLQKSGLYIRAIMIPPRASVYNLIVHQTNTAAYYAARSLGIEIYSPWDQFALESGGWSVATISSDNTHPVASARTTASATLVSQIRNSEIGMPIIRTRNDSIAVNGCFAVDSGGDGLADGWAKEYSGISVAIYSLDAYGSNGHKWQTLAFSDLAAGSYASIKQRIASGFSPGDVLAFYGDLQMSIDDSIDDKFFASIRIKFLGSGLAEISSVYANGAIKQSSGSGKFYAKAIVPDGTISLEIILGGYCWGDFAGSASVGFGRVGLTNISSLGIPSDVLV